VSNTLRQEVLLAGSPDRVYRALTDATKFAAMTGAPTEITAEAGGAFTCFGGMIVGRFIEVVRDQRLVQAWRVKAWDAGVYSLVRFELRAEAGATRVTLEHTGFPEGEAEHLAAGWHQNYWEPLKKHLA
jgi:activator of HSP90 ATPase